METSGALPEAKGGIVLGRVDCLFEGGFVCAYSVEKVIGVFLVFFRLYYFFIVCEVFR